MVILGRAIKADYGKFVKWDAKTMGSWCQQLEGALALFNLTGRSIVAAYRKNKALILNSVDSTQILGEAISCIEPRGLAQCQHGNDFKDIVEIYNLT